MILIQVNKKRGRKFFESVAYTKKKKKKILLTDNGNRLINLSIEQKVTIVYYSPLLYFSCNQ